MPDLSDHRVFAASGNLGPTRLVSRGPLESRGFPISATRDRHIGNYFINPRIGSLSLNLHLTATPSSNSTNPAVMMGMLTKGPIHFGPFQVTSQVFHVTAMSFALVNIKPLLPGHVLVSPLRNVPRISDLTSAEVTDLFLTVNRVGKMVERVYNASSLNIAIQDGIDAGQSVPHVHTHIIPRKRADLDSRGGSDAIYGMLDGEEGDIAKHLWERMEKRGKFPSVDNDLREPRTEEEMVEEAERLVREMEFEVNTVDGE